MTTHLRKYLLITVQSISYLKRWNLFSLRKKLILSIILSLFPLKMQAQKIALAVHLSAINLRTSATFYEEQISEIQVLKNVVNIN